MAEKKLRSMVFPGLTDVYTVPQEMTDFDDFTDFVESVVSIISDGNIHAAIPAGGYVYVKNHLTLQNGLYKNITSATIAANATLTTSNVALQDEALNGIRSTIAKPNLLLNPYFIGGWSGTYPGNAYGVFPVNQRGSGTTTGGTGGAYCVDGWNISRGIATILTSGLQIKWDGVNNTFGYIRQFISSPDALFGKAVVFSALVNNTLIVNAWDNVSATSKSVTVTVDGYDVTLQINFSGTPRVNILTYAAGNVHVLKAVKLEIGDTQTLAHLENGTWVLNEVPDYETELLKCSTAQTDSDDTYANKVVAYLSDAPVKTGNVQISYGNTTTILTEGIIPGDGMFYIFLGTQIMQPNIASIYCVRRLNSSYNVVPIVEGSSSEAPRISSTGVLNLNTSGTGRYVHWATIPF